MIDRLATYFLITLEADYGVTKFSHDIRLAFVPRRGEFVTVWCDNGEGGEAVHLTVEHVEHQTWSGRVVVEVETECYPPEAMRHIFDALEMARADQAKGRERSVSK